MDRLGIQSLNAGAPDLRLTGEHNRGSYVQRRRAQMAGGGIMGSNAGSMLVAPTADGSRPEYGVLDKLKRAGKKVVGKIADIIPNELKDPVTNVYDKLIPNELKNPVVAATLANYAPVMMGGDNTLLQKGIGAITGTTPENNALDYLKSIIPGQGGGVEDILASEDIGSIPTQKLPSPSSGNILTDVLGGVGNVAKKVGQTIIPGGEKGYFDLYDLPLQALSGITGLTGTALGWDSDKSLAENLAGLGTAGKVGAAVAGGLTAGKMQQDWLDKQPAFPADETGIKFQTAAEAMADPNLRFKPQAQYANVAEGGRIGYAFGKSVEQQRDVISAFAEYKYGGGKKQFTSWFNNVWLPSTQAGLPDISRRSVASAEEEPWEFQGYAEPGTIGSPEAIGIEYNAQGGRIGAQEGGLMNLGGMEKDYRQEGGFVPIGGEEKADDVPARLSRNEFVFTADAVRNAGGGDIDAGAEVMENLMEHLEAGGKVSEDSQGLEGAQAMFANTQRLQNRII